MTEDDKLEAGIDKGHDSSAHGGTGDDRRRILLHDDHLGGRRLARESRACENRGERRET
jgi:hypothetical protein